MKKVLFILFISFSSFAQESKPKAFKAGTISFDKFFQIVTSTVQDRVKTVKNLGFKQEPTEAEFNVFHNCLTFSASDDLSNSPDMASFILCQEVCCYISTVPNVIEGFKKAAIKNGFQTTKIDGITSYMRGLEGRVYTFQITKFRNLPAIMMSIE